MCMCMCVDKWGCGCGCGNGCARVRVCVCAWVCECECVQTTLRKSHSKPKATPLGASLGAIGANRNRLVKSRIVIKA